MFTGGDTGWLKRTLDARSTASTGADMRPRTEGPSRRSCAMAWSKCRASTPSFSQTQGI
jgi:hypothetical protein